MAEERVEMQMSILNRLMFVKAISYGDLHKDFKNQHDLFNHHLKVLVEKEFVNKKEATYSLTAKGRQYVAHMEEDGTVQKQFKVSMFINIIRKNGDKYQNLLFKRLKHPHYGYIGTVTGKLKWGDSIEENLTRELYEELKIKPLSYKILGVTKEIFRNGEGEKVGDGVYFIIVVDKFKGIPLKKNIEGEYFWHDIDQILNLDKIFRSGFERGLPYLNRYIQDPQNYTQYIMEGLDEEKLEY